jgi:hypothetical protein
MIRCLVAVVVCLFATSVNAVTSVNALTMEECRTQYKADMAPRRATRMSWHDYQMKRCGIDPNGNASTPSPSAPIKH